MTQKQRSEVERANLYDDDGYREDVKRDKEAFEKAAEAVKEDLDDLMDEIDTILEENGEEMALNYRQSGGE